MTQLGTSKVHEASLALAGKHWVRTSLDNAGVVTVRVRLPWWSWMFLGAWHVHLWWKLETKLGEHLSRPANNAPTIVGRPIPLG